MTDKQYERARKIRCEKCKIRKAYAKMDFHWHDHEDCPYVCPFVKEMENKK